GSLAAGTRARGALRVHVYSLRRPPEGGGEGAPRGAGRLTAARAREEAPDRMSSTRLRPVLLGTDLGIYAMARSFHETFGVTSVVVSELPRGPVNDAAILHTEFTGADSRAEDTLSALTNVAAQDPEATHVLLVNSDHQLAFVLAHREQLGQHYVVPCADAAAVARLADKTAMYRVLAELGIPAPATVPVDPGAGEQAWRAA